MQKGVPWDELIHLWKRREEGNYFGRKTLSQE